MIKGFREKLKSKDARSLIENFLSLSSLQVISIVLPLCTLPYLLRVLGKSNYGIIILAVSLVNYFISLTDYSFRISATREVSIHRHSQARISLIYSEVMSVKIVLLLISSIVISGVIFLYKPFYIERYVFFLTLPMLFGYAIFPEWFFQGIEKMKYITFLNIGIKLFFTVCVFIFIHKSSDYLLYPAVQSLGFIFAGLIAQFILFRKYKVRFYWIGHKRIVRSLKLNFPLFMNQFMPTLYNNTGVLLLGIYTNASQVGIYDAIKKIIDVGIAMMNVISRVFFPYLNRVKNSFRAYKDSMIFLAIAASLIPIFGHKIILWYLGITYADALLILTILSIGVFFLTIYDIFGLNFFIIRRQDKLVMQNTIIASLIGFILAFPLIGYYGIIGAAINLTASRMLMGGGLYLQYRRFRK